MVRNTASRTPGEICRELAKERPIAIPIGDDYLTGSVAVPPAPIAVVLIANDSGCSRQRAGERDLARALRRAGLATVMLDVLMPSEQVWPEVAAQLRMDAELRAKRIEAGREWIRRQPQLAALPTMVLGSGERRERLGDAVATVARARLGARCAA
jgi:putative phosphoribosyl transferase